jgi:hydroxymethylpyrimidine/phosphomethylpyrimidine kinase
MIPRVLVIAGSDSGGGAGIQADIKTITMLGGHAATAITAVTAQNTMGVTRVDALSPEAVVAQIDAVLGDIGADAIKIGMLGSAAVADAVAEMVERMAGIPLVFDPVMIATSGATLADDATTAVFDRFLKRATIVTPNAPELAALTGRKIADHHDAEEGAVDILLRHGCAVLAKGGHLPEAEPGLLLDTLIAPDGPVGYLADRIETRHTHGTGCTLASAIAVGLAGGLSLQMAVARATAYVADAIARAPRLGQGAGPIGHTLGQIPYHHFVAAKEGKGADTSAVDARWPPIGKAESTLH